MSKYTTELRFICETVAGLTESTGYTDIERVISTAREKIFDFDYPIFDSDYKSVLETKILKHFYTREIGEETYGLWKLRLNTKLNEIMPYYNKLYNSELLEFNPLYTTNLTREHTTNVKGTTDSTTSGSTNSYVSTSSNQSSTTSGNTTNSSINKYSDTPQGRVNDLLNDAYLTNATVDNDTSDSSSNSNVVISGNNSGNVGTSATGKVENNSTEDYVEKVSGYEGHDVNKLLAEFRKNLLNIDMLIIDELEYLFIQLW